MFRKAELEARFDNNSSPKEDPMDKFTRALIFSLFMALVASATVSCDSSPGEPGDDQDIITGQDASHSDQKWDEAYCGPYGCVQPPNDTGGGDVDVGTIYCDDSNYYEVCPEGWACVVGEHRCVSPEDWESVNCWNETDCPGGTHCYQAKRLCYSDEQLSPYLWLEEGSWRQTKAGATVGNFQLYSFEVMAFDRELNAAVVVGVPPFNWRFRYDEDSQLQISAYVNEETQPLENYQLLPEDMFLFQVYDPSTEQTFEFVYQFEASD